MESLRVSGARENGIPAKGVVRAAAPPCSAQPVPRRLHLEWSRTLRTVRGDQSSGEGAIRGGRNGDDLCNGLLTALIQRIEACYMYAFRDTYDRIKKVPCLDVSKIPSHHSLVCNKLVKLARSTHMISILGPLPSLSDECS